MRNTTEALDIIISGLDWQQGDEAIVSDQDYGSMLEAFDQQAERCGIRVDRIALPLHPKDDQEIVAAFEQAITPKTRLMLVTHLINLSGQILPVKKIAEMAHRYGVEVISDSAHAVGQLPFRVDELGADYLGSSLHKWMGCPIGVGMLYIRPDKIRQVWPLFGDRSKPPTDIRKFEHTGTRPPAQNLAIAHALRFHRQIGVVRKAARLHYLKAR